MSRRANDGDESGYKLDRFRNSRFEQDSRKESNENYNKGVTRRTFNTISGKFNDNRGRRSDEMGPRSKWDGSPFEDGEIYNWNKRKGWDEYYQSYDRGNRNRGGALIGSDQSNIGQRGRGPRGYKRSDDSIYEDVCDMLSRSSDVDATEIEVSVKEGIVYLNGTVPDRDTKKMAELEIENISGVIDVQNLLNFIQSKKDLH